MIKINNITFAYEKTPVLTDVSFDINTGDWLGILGPNGSGKTTLLKCLSRTLFPQNGTIEINERDINSFTHKEIAQIAGIVPQDSNPIFPFTAFEIVLMGRAPYKKGFGFETARDVEIAKSAMIATDAWQFAGRPIQELSGGERQRVIIARALAQEPKVLLLDEPTSFLDIKHQQEILNIIKKLNRETGLTVVSAMHDINLALLYCKTIAFLKDGEFFKIGRPDEIVTYANLKTVFNTEVYVGINDLNGRPYYLPL